MIRITIQYILATFWWLLIGIKCQMQKESDEHDEDGFIQHFYITADPNEFQTDNKIPLRMGIWMGVVLGIFVLMAVGVCCGLFCKYSGKMATAKTEVATPIPIVVTPPSRTNTLGSFTESGYTNHGYSGNGSSQNGDQCCASASPPESPTHALPMYTDLARSNEMNASFKRIVKGDLETPPPFYITASPFKGIK